MLEELKEMMQVSIVGRNLYGPAGERDTLQDWLPIIWSAQKKPRRLYPAPETAKWTKSLCIRAVGSEEEVGLKTRV